MATKTIEGGFTEARVRKAGPGEYTDDGPDAVRSLRLYVGDTGVKTWGVYRWDSVKKYPVRKSLGRWPDMTVDEAREAAREKGKLIAKGVDLKPPPEPAKESTLGELTKAYTLRLKQREARSSNWADRAITRSCADWLDRPLSAIRKTDIENRHLEIAATRGKAVAAQTVKALRTIFTYAIDNEDEVYSGKNTAKQVKVENSEPRQRVLSPEETKKVMAALDWEGFYPWVRQYFRLLLLTGVRKMNLASARWDEFDLDRGLWTIPASKSKNKKTMPIILRPEAVEILRERLGDHPEFVFASRKRGTEGGHMKDAGQTWARVLKRAGVSGVTIHDIRRSFGSVLVNSGVPITVVAKAMGHSDARTTMKHYSVVDPNTVRSALERVAAF